MIRLKYAPNNWFWFVSGDSDRVYSSAAASYIPVTDSRYTNWVSLGNRTSKIINEAELWDVLNSQYPQGLQKNTVPEEVFMRQARRALLDIGLLTTVNDAISAMPGVEGESARIDWEFAATVRRDWPLVAALGGILNLSEDQLDSLFIAASVL